MFSGTLEIFRCACRIYTPVSLQDNTTKMLTTESHWLSVSTVRFSLKTAVLLSDELASLYVFLEVLEATNDFCLKNTQKQKQRNAAMGIITAGL